MDERQYRHYDISCEVHGDLGQVVGAYDAGVMLDQHRQFDICTRAVANPAHHIKQRAVRRMAMIYCKSCKQVAPEGDPDALTGYYRVQLKGDFRPMARNVQPGFYCSEVCLTVACMYALNVPREEIQSWIADVTGVTARP
jgi:hypothetical protein